MFVSEVAWSLHKSRTSGKTTLKARYYGGIADEPIDHYLGVFDYDEKPFYQRKCRQFVSKYLEKSGVSLEWDGLNQFEGLPHPKRAAKRIPPTSRRNVQTQRQV